MAVLGIVAWGIWFGQKLLESGFRETQQEIQEDADLPAWGQAILTIVTIIYYNSILLVAITLGGYIAATGYPTLGAILAFVYPAYDMESVYRGIPLSLAGVVAIGFAVGIAVFSIKDEVSWREIDLLAPVERLMGFRGGKLS